MPHVVFGCVVVLRHRFVCDTTRPHANLTVYTFWRCKYALLYLSDQNVRVSIYRSITLTCFQLKKMSVLGIKLMSMTTNTHQACYEYFNETNHSFSREQPNKRRR